ncbi:MAG: DUF1570 domain-containing protein [Planctomycetota bacterium]
MLTNRLDANRFWQSCFGLVAYTSILLGSGQAWAQRIQLSAEADSKPVETIQIEFKDENGVQESTIAEVWAREKAGHLLILTPDGQLKTVLKEQQISVNPTKTAMQPLTQQEIFDDLKSKLPPGFALRKTKHYVIVYNTSEAYAEWVGLLFEQLYRGFYNYWGTRHRVDLQEPRFPLVALVFNNKQSYIQFARPKVGDAAETMIGFYDMQTNRMVTYDLTGANGMANGQNSQASNARLIDQILRRPQAERTVATIVHEAVHQIAYNSGLQVRLADNPRWLSEGLAMFFESPSARSKTGWTMGNVNYHNLIKFKQNFSSRQADSLTSLISSDARLLDSRQATLAYPESWALTYFLINTKKTQFKNYMLELAELPPAGPTLEKARVETFKKHFGDDLEKLDRDFLKYLSRLR